MTRNLLPISVIFALVGTIASGLIHGRISHRWGEADQLATVKKRIESFPESFGRWRRQQAIEMPKSVSDMLENPGYNNGVYVNEETGQTVRTALIVGFPGPIAAHIPEICYSSRQYKLNEETRLVKLSGLDQQRHKFRMVTMNATDVGANRLRVYYGWNDGSRWTAPENHRFAFAGKSYLYKIQIAGQLTTGRDNKEIDPAKDFLQAFLDHVDPAQFRNAD